MVLVYTAYMCFTKIERRVEATAVLDGVGGGGRGEKQILKCPSPSLGCFGVSFIQVLARTQAAIPNSRLEIPIKG